MRKYYKVLHGDQEENQEKNEIVIDSLKKYNRKMIILKIIIVILSVFILSIWGKFIVERVQKSIEQQEDYEKGQCIYDIIEEAYSNMNELINSENYSIIEESISISQDFKCVYDYLKKETYYKDGYFKEVSTANSGSINTIENIDLNYVNYGVKTKDKDFYIQLNDNNYINGDITTSEANYKITDSTLEVYCKENVLEYKDYEIKEEEIDGKNYYIISQKENKEDGVYCTEIWINKENMQLFKIANEKVGSKKTERTFTLLANNVKDEDVKVNYQGEDEKLQELGEFFEKINNGEFEDAYEEVIKWNDNNWETKILFNTYVKPNKKVITREETMEIILNKYEIEAGYMYSYKGIIFDQNGDAYYVYEQDRTVDRKNVFVQNIFVSIFGDIIKTNDINMELNTGDLVIL